MTNHDDEYGHGRHAHDGPPADGYGHQQPPGGYEQGYGDGAYDPNQGAYEQGGYGQGAYEQGQGGYGQPPGQDPRPYGAAPDGTYVPEPLAGPLPPYAEPQAPYGAPPAGDTWSGHAPAADGGGPYEAPPAGHGWGPTPPPVQQWEHAEPGGYGYAGPAPYADPAADWSQAQARSQAHGYAEPQPYAQPGRGGETERTAVLPVVDELPQQQASPGQGQGHGHGRGHGRSGPQQPAAAPAGTTAPAPVRTGSPIIAPGIQPAALTAALGLLLAGGAAVGKPGLAVVLVALQAVTAAGWFRLNGMWPARQGILLAFLSGVTADVALLIADGDHGAEVLAGTLGVWLLLVLVLQMRHRGSADERMSSLTATSVSTLLTVLAASYLATMTSDAGSDPVVVGAVAVAVAAVIRALPLPGAPVSVGAALLVAAGSGFLTGSATGMANGDAVLLAAAAGACALIGLRVASYDFPSRFVHFTAGVALPLTVAAPAVYILGRALTG